MKKVFYAVLFSSLLLITACDSETGQETEDVFSEQEMEEPKDDNIDENDNNADTNQENPDEKNSSENEDAEETNRLYEVSDNYAYINVIDGEEANEHVALLTYDDAPDGNALAIADILEEYDAPAIFFVNGIFIDGDTGEEDLLQLYERGFEIGNHGYTHANLQNLSEEEQYEEIIATSDRIEEVTGERPRFFRAPYGANTEFSTQTALEDGMMLMNWTYGYDWELEYQNSDALADIMLNTELLIPGANLLMHDRQWTVEATATIIEGLRERDYELLDPSLIRSVESEGQEESEG